MPNPAGEAPRLSVIVAAWNAEATIEVAVRSALDQDDAGLECVVVDDGSTDATPSILARLAAEDPRLVVERQDPNEGVSAARNRALALARGEWLTFLDADDRLLPGGLGAVLRAGEAADALAVVGQRISTDGERTWFPKLYDLPDIREPGRKSLATHPDLLYYVGPVGKLFRRAIAEDLRFEGRMLGDQPWVVRALVRAGDRIVVVDDLVYEWRRPHPDHYIPTITSARERSAALGTEAVRMAGVAFDVAARAFAAAYDPSTATRLETAYLRRLLRADLAAQLHRATERRDPDLAGLIDALRTLLTRLPGDAVRGAEDAVRVEIVESLARDWGRLARPARRAFLQLAAAVDGIDPRVLRRVRARSRRLPLRLAVGVPVVGVPLASLALGVRALFHRSGSAPAVTPGPGSAR